jgi:molecular chaperone Hsp33
LPSQLTPREFGADATLAITIESNPVPQREPMRYQGLIELDADSLSAALEGYFTRSEQLPTRLMLSADEQIAAGILLQQLPDSSRHADVDAWPRAQALFDTLGGEELRTTAPEQLLYRLFHEEEVRLLGSQPLRFGCSCSQQRVESMLVSLGREEAFSAQQSGVVEVTCEFCNQQYRFDAVDLEQLFAGAISAPGSSTPQ